MYLNSLLEKSLGYKMSPLINLKKCKKLGWNGAQDYLSRQYDLGCKNMIRK